MRKIFQCYRCQYYAGNSHLVCALHPSGVANDIESCDDFYPRHQISIPKSPKIKQADLKIAESVIEDLSYRDKEEANQFLAIALAELMYDPVEELLKQPLSDFYYYVLRLSQMLTGYGPTENPDEYSLQAEPESHGILIHKREIFDSPGNSRSTEL